MRLMSGRDFPLPLLGLVHTSIEITRHTALAATGEYELAVYVDRLTPHRKGTEAVVMTELRERGTLVWESTSTYLARHRTGPEPSVEETGRPARQSGPLPDRAASPTDRTGSPTDRTGPLPDRAASLTDRAASPTDQSAPAAGRHAAAAGPTEPATGRSRTAGGEVWPGPLPVLDEWRLAADVGRRYGAASGDRNPIHLHPLTARLFGFPRAIAHGMWTVARCLAAHGVPQAVRVGAEFRAPVLLPGTVAFAADGSRFELRGTGEAGRLHVSGRVDPLTAPAGP
jgi:acyl dehydratase